MQKVIELAKLTPIQTRPNPKVASIIVKNNEIIGIGCHLKKGEHHSEIHALQQANEKSQNATLYVNLEPCSHFGSTPPCADAVIKSGIKRVVIANLDPNPMVSGTGVKKLQDAGIEVIYGVLDKEASSINQVFFHNITTQKPYVTLKVGMSLDAKIATKDNLSQWITSRDSRADSHQYRVSHEGILVGVGTIINDDPTLTAHLVNNSPRHPIRIILDTRLETPIISKVVNDGLAPTWIITTNTDLNDHKPYQDKNCKIISLPSIDTDKVLKELYQHGIYSLLIEGGERVYSDFLDSKNVNQIISYISPQMIGSKDAKHFYAGLGFNNLASNLKLEFIECKQLSSDIKIISQVIN
ncbi:MAG: bifunctional diaminohydroxyphosphoribosylaminopyrimidine deaminase/5-amino-6-(5-phosphoribosylamino)uracil reductase RibD [Burkholderiales bacterium]|nr:bifunctional diaminohydroxyphosphoribosylaminopyrimidine deaminase/5-amino-6-(5-phosphoribosylamino)uracil reductase RibD [Burkholderiales bacterium]